LAGKTAGAYYLNTLYYADTLGQLTQGAFSTKYMDRSIVKIIYSPVDSSYIAIGYLKTAHISVSYTKLCIGKYDRDLNLIWEKTYGEAMPGNGLVNGTVLEDGSIVAAGTYAGLASQPFTNSNANGVILKIDKKGDLLWAREYDHVGQGNLVEMFHGLDQTLDKGFILCGSVIGPPSNKSKAWVVKTDSLGCVVPGCTSSAFQETSIHHPPPPAPPPLPPPLPPITGVETEQKNPEGVHLRLYPNPVREDLSLQLSGFPAYGGKDLRVRICNRLGQAVFSEVLYGPSARLNLGELAPGLYILQVLEQNRLMGTAKFVKEE
jgi:hypothetical protein